MKNQLQMRNSCAQSGFTLLELVITIFVFGVLCAAAAVSWGSFMKYQNLRDSANSFHKELLALKAKALESNNTFTISYKNNNKEYEVTVTGTDDNDNSITDKFVKTGNFNNNVIFSTQMDGWASEIKITPDNLNAFGTGKGSVVIESSKSKKKFRIMKAENSIKPELQYSNDGGVTWTKV